MENEVEDVFIGFQAEFCAYILVSTLRKCAISLTFALDLLSEGSRMRNARRGG